MQIGIIYNVFIRDFRKQRKRIVLTLVALAWGTISVILLLSFGEGLRSQMTKNSRGMGQNIAVVWGGQTSKAFKGMGIGRPIRLLWDDVAYLKERVPSLQEIGGEYHRWGARVEYKDIVLSEHINGAMPNYELMRNFIPQPGGRMINKLDMEKKRRVAFLGPDLKKRLFDEQDPIGEEIMINNMPFTVVGIMIEKLMMNNYSGQDSDYLVIPATTFEVVFGEPWLDNLVYMPKDPGNMAQVEKELTAAMAAKHKFDPEDDRALSTWDTIKGARELNNMLVGIKIFLGIIGTLTLLIAGIGVANIMYVSVKERTREIGVKMAVGARKSLILWQFLIEALLMTSIGGLIGIGFSIALTEGFKLIPMDSQVMSYMGRPTVSINIGLIVIGILAIMGVVAGVFPAMKAASVSPVESLRYE